MIGLCNGLAPNRRQAIICTNDILVYWRIYAFTGGWHYCEMAWDLFGHFQKYHPIIQNVFEMFNNKRNEKQMQFHVFRHIMQWK